MSVDFNLASNSPFYSDSIQKLKVILLESYNSQGQKFIHINKNMDGVVSISLDVKNEQVADYRSIIDLIEEIAAILREPADKQALLSVLKNAKFDAAFDKFPKNEFFRLFIDNGPLDRIRFARLCAARCRVSVDEVFAEM